METTIVSSKFQVVIPKKIRQQFNVKPGQRVIFIPYRKSLRMIIAPTVEEGYGILAGMNTENIREEHAQ